MERKPDFHVVKANPMQHFTIQNRDCALDSVFHREPVQKAKQQGGIFLAMCVTEQADCCILYQFVAFKALGFIPRQRKNSVVNPGDYNTHSL